MLHRVIYIFQQVKNRQANYFLKLKTLKCYSLVLRLTVSSHLNFFNSGSYFLISIHFEKAGGKKELFFHQILLAHFTYYMKIFTYKYIVYKYNNSFSTKWFKMTLNRLSLINLLAPSWRSAVSLRAIIMDANYMQKTWRGDKLCCFNYYNNLCTE